MHLYYISLEILKSQYFLQYYFFSPLQAQVEFRHKHYNESAALCTRSRGTSLYAIAIGVCLSLGYGILVGAGLSLNWYD